MAGTATKGKRVAAKGAAMGGAVVEAPITGVGTVALVSMGIKFLRLFEDAPCKRSKKDEDNSNKCEQEHLKIVGWQVRD